MKKAGDLAASGEEGLEEFGRLRGEDAGDDFHSVIEAGVRENFKTGLHPAAAWVIRGVD